MILTSGWCNIEGDSRGVCCAGCTGGSLQVGIPSYPDTDG